MELPTPILDARFAKGLAVLCRFVRRHGHARVPARHTERGYPLGTWVWTKRIRYRLGRLRADQVKRLEALPGWSWDPRGDAFADNVALLRGYIRREGHARVPEGHEEQGRRLGVWVRYVRESSRIGRLSPKQSNALQAIPGWSWEPHKRDAFETRYVFLERFVKREGHARVPVDHQERGWGLGSWVSIQRRKYRNGLISADRVARFEGLPGWSWGPRQESFERNLAALRRHVRRTGHAHVPLSRRRPSSLAVWARRQRQEYRRARLDPTRVKLLEKLPGWSWGAVEDWFERGLAPLRDFVQRQGHARVPQAHVEQGFRLGRWVAERRAAFKAGKLDPRRAAELERVRGWVWRMRPPDRRQHDQRLPRSSRTSG